MQSIIQKAGACALLTTLAFHASAQAVATPAGGAAVDAAAANAAPTPAVVADPAVWGPYAKLVGKTFAGEDASGWPGYASKTRSIQWEVPGEVMLETGKQANDSELPQMRIKPGKGVGDLYFDVARSPNVTGRIVDADTLAFDLPFGYQNVVRVTGADSYEMKTIKGGEVKAGAVYRDTASEAHQVRSVELTEKAIADKHAAMLALRAAGVPDEPATDAPADRVLAYQEPVRGPSGTLQVTRGKAWEGGACFLAVYINGRWAARLEDAETARFKVPAGKVAVGVATDPAGRGTCRYGQSTQVVHETVVGKGESLHVQFELNSGVRFREALLAPANQ